MTIRFLFTSNLNFSHAKTSWPSFKSCYLVFHASKILLENHMILVCRLRTVKIRSIRASRTVLLVLVHSGSRSKFFACPGQGPTGFGPWTPVFDLEWACLHFTNGIDRKILFGGRSNKTMWISLVETSWRMMNIFIRLNQSDI